MIQVSMTVAESTQQFALSLAEQRSYVTADIEQKIVAGTTSPPYTGPYTVTPTEATQTLATRDYAKQTACSEQS